MQSCGLISSTRCGMPKCAATLRAFSRSGESSKPTEKAIGGASSEPRRRQRVANAEGPRNLADVLNSGRTIANRTMGSYHSYHPLDGLGLLSPQFIRGLVRTLSLPRVCSYFYQPKISTFSGFKIWIYNFKLRKFVGPEFGFRTTQQPIRSKNGPIRTLGLNYMTYF